MAVNSILPPYPSFFDTDGAPLEDGYIYIGQPGLEATSSPKASFFDFALTVPTGTASGAAVRTLSGFPVYAGAAAIIYVDGDFSITVTDKGGALMYSALNRTFAFSTADTTGIPVQAPDGNFAEAGFGFINEPSSGFVRQGPGVVQSTILGNLVSQETIDGTEFVLPVSGDGFVSGVAAALDTDLKQIAAITAAEGDMIYRNATEWVSLPKGTAGQDLAMNVGATAPAWLAGAVGTQQTWALQTRVSLTSYQNTTGRAIAVSLRTTIGVNPALEVSTDGVTWVVLAEQGTAEAMNIFGIIPNGHYYRARATNWAELR